MVSQDRHEAAKHTKYNPKIFQLKLKDLGSVSTFQAESSDYLNEVIVIPLEW